MRRPIKMPEFPPVGPVVTFSPAGPHSLKVKCDICGRTGWGPATSDIEAAPDDAIVRWSPWQLTCGSHGHLPCPRCGRMLRAKLNGEARLHTRCPKGDQDE